MKTIFILGAGASRQAGGPLMSDFLDHAEKLLRLQTGGVMQAKDSFLDVFKAIADLQAVHSKSYLDLDNIEVLFGAIEMAQLIGKLGDRDQSEIIKLRDSIITLIFKTLEYGIKFPVRDKHIFAPEPYDTFITMLSEVNRHRQKLFSDLHSYSFITFNYDLTLDYALYHNMFYYDYCLSEERDSGNYPYLKLHGSINWGICEKCGKIIPSPLHEANFNIWSDTEYVYYNLGSTLSFKQHCNGSPLKGPPILVPPTWSKTGYHEQLGNVWKWAAKELSVAENIFVIGYSLPETDLFFRYLFALGSESSTRIKRFWVFNPDHTVENRFQEIIGRGIKTRFQFLPAKFNEAIPAIHMALMEP